MTPIEGPPRVTAIMIVLNGEKFIDEAIASVVDQTFGAWELIVVDDGSRDGTRDKVSRWISIDPRIRLERHPDHGNHGMSASRNLGLSLASGEYVGFLDADDTWLPGKLQDQVAILDREPAAAIVYGRTLIWHEWAPNPGRKDYFYDLGVEPDRLHEPPRLFIQLLANVHQTPTTCNALMRKDRVQAVGGFQDEFRAMFEDQVFFAKLLASYPAYVANTCWARYRQHPGGVSSYEVDRRSTYRLHIAYLKCVAAYLSNAGDAGGGAAAKAIRKAIWKVRLNHYSHLAKRRMKGILRA